MKHRSMIAKLSGLLLTFVLLGGSAAFAASLSVTADRLTTFQAATSITPESCTVTASEDSYVDENDPANTTLGSQTTLTVRSRNNRNAHTLTKFSFASCPNFSNASILSASLQLRLLTAPTASRTYNIQPITSTWSETVTWNTQPTVGAVTTSTATGTTNNVSLTWSGVGMVADVQSWVATPANNHGWEIRDSAQNAAGTGFTGSFSSRTHATQPGPTLTITYYP